jgi:hypothetical protein
VKFSSPADVGGGYEAFQYRTLLAVSASLGLPYHLVTGDVRQANYSSLRAELVEFRRRVEQLQHGGDRAPALPPDLGAVDVDGLGRGCPRSAGVRFCPRPVARSAVDPAALGLGRSAEGHPGAGPGDRRRAPVAAQGGRGHRLRHRGIDRENAADAARATELGLGYRAKPGETQGARATSERTPETDED